MDSGWLAVQAPRNDEVDIKRSQDEQTSDAAGDVLIHPQSG